MEDFNVLELCRRLRKSKGYPYVCPVTSCGKTYRGICSLQYHLVHAEHPIEILKSIFDDLPDAPPSTPYKHHGRKKSRYSRSLLNSSKKLQSIESDGISYYCGDSNSVEFKMNNETVIIKITTPLRVLSKENYEKTYGDKKIQPSKNASSPVLRLPVASFREIDNYNISDAPPLPVSYVRFIERSPEELDGEVEYDMDEEDTAWLEMMNEQRTKSDVPPVTVEQFELLMDRLEKESYFLVQMNKEVDSSLAVIDDEAVCSICLDGECQNSNVILFCDMCNLAVHQDCYGVPYIPEGHWLCRRCINSPSAPVDCVLCPNNGGAFKQTDRAHWAHVVCALWIPEVRFANTVFLEPIDSIESIPAARWRLTCYICKQRGVGACIQCQKNNCYSAFHVTCAQQAGLYMKMDTVKDSRIGAVLVQKIAYCDAHTPPEAENKMKQQQGQKKKNELLSPEDKMKNARRVLAKKRSIAPVISIPTVPPERVQEIASIVTIAKKSQFIQRLIGYWTLKRQFRNGVPLLRRLQTSHLQKRDDTISGDKESSEAVDIFQNPKYWRSLRQDLERARLLCELVRKREKLKKELIKIEEEYTMIIMSPFNAFLDRVVNLLKQKDTGEIFLEPVDQTEVPDYGEIVTDPMDLQTMTENIKSFKYKTLESLEKDFNLMIANCLAYNAKDTIFYRAALRMKEQGGIILKQAKKMVTSLKFDMKNGTLIGVERVKNKFNNNNWNNEEIMQEQPISENEDELELRGLLQTLERTKFIRNKSTKMKRVKFLKAKIDELKEKLSRNEVEEGKRDNAVKVKPENIKDKEDSKTNEMDKDAVPSHSGKHTRMKRKKDRKNQSNSGKTSAQSKDSFKVYRSNQDAEGSDVEETNSEVASVANCSSYSGSSSSSSDSSSSDSENKDDDDEEDEDDEAPSGDTETALEKFQLVWAKAKGFPWYPALIINPEMPRGYVHNGIPIPSPPKDMLKTAENYEEPVYLVLLYDTKRTWQWLPRTKLEPLGINNTSDKLKINEVKKTSDRKAVKKAYQEALLLLKTPSDS